MNPLLELNPESCIIVIGPSLARSCLPEGEGAGESGDRALCLSFLSLMLAGASLLGKEQRGDLQEQLKNGDPDKVLELESILASKSLREKWLKESLTLSSTQDKRLSVSETLQLLLRLQEKGSRLVYTGYDMILDTVAGSTPVLIPPNDEPHHSSSSNLLSRWIKGSTNGFLHIHGCISSASETPSSEHIVIHHSQYTPLVNSPLFLPLKELFRHRSILFLGHETDYFNPLLPQMIKILLGENEILKNPPILISSLQHSKVPESFLHLQISKHEENHCLQELINESKGETSFISGKSADKSIDRDCIRSQAILLFSEKQSFRKLGDIIYQLNQSGEIYVRRDALTILFGNRIMYGNILTYGGNGLHQIWDLVLFKDSVLQSKGLVAIALLSSFMVWVNRKPEGLGSITDVNTFHSLWNNSLTAINQSGLTTVSIPSKSITSSVVTSPPHSPVFSPLATGPSPITYTPGPPTRQHSFLPLLPFNLLQFTRTPLLPLPVLPLTTVPSLGGRCMSLNNPTTNLSFMQHNIISSMTTGMGMSPVTGTGMSLATGTRVSPVTGTGMSLATGTGVSPVTGMGMSLATGTRVSPVTGTGMSLATGTRMSLATSEGMSGMIVTRGSNYKDSDNESNVSVDDPAITVNEERVMAGEARAQRLSKSSSSSSVNSTDHIITNNTTNTYSYGSRLLVAESPTSQEDALDKILALGEVSITHLDTRGASGAVSAPTQRNPLQLLPSPLSFLPQSFPLRAGLSSAYSPLLAYPSSPYMPLLVANQPQGLGGFINPGGALLPLRTVLPPTCAGASFLPNTVRHVAVNQSGIAEQSMEEEPQAGQRSNSNNTEKPTTDSNGRVRGRRKTMSTPVSVNDDGIISPSFQERMISQPLPPPPSLRPLREDEQRSARSPPALIRIEELETSQSKRRRETDDMRGETAKKERRDALEDLSLERKKEKVSSSSSSSSIEKVPVEFPSDHLWKFLLHLLLSPNHGHVIQWTGQGYEFQITDHSALTQMWACHSNSAPLSYHGLIGELRSYSGLEILESISEDELIYQFKLDIQAYLSIHINSISTKS